MREVAQTFLAARSRAIPMLFAAALAGSLTASLTINERAQLASDIQQRVDQGWTDLRYRGDGGAISTEDCANLAELDGVTHAGASTSLGFVTAEPLPRSVPLETIDPRYVNEDFTHVSSGVLVPRRLLDELDEDLVALRMNIDGEVTEAELLQSPAPPDLGGSILSPGELGLTAESCNVSIAPRSVGSLESVILSQISTFGPQPQLLQGAVIGVFDADPYQDYLTRPTRWLGAALGFVLAILGAVLLRARSNDLAVLRLAGTSNVDLLLMLCLEGLLVLLTFGLAAAGAGLALSTVVRGTTLASVGASALPFVPSFMAVWTLAATRALARPISDLVKDR